LLRWPAFACRFCSKTALGATSLADFWSRRWHLGFVEMDRAALFLRPYAAVAANRVALIALFALSGV